MKPLCKIHALRRLRRIEGQVRGLARMVEEDKYCIRVLHQSLAAKAALSSFEDFILENHLATHVAAQMRSGEVGKAIKEVVGIYRLSKKK